MAKAEHNAEKRYIPPGSCTWCGHKPHDTDCTQNIRTGKGSSSTCPCTRHRWKASTTR